jgi:hypothetical protein
MLKTVIDAPAGGIGAGSGTGFARGSDVGFTPSGCLSLFLAIYYPDYYFKSVVFITQKPLLYNNKLSSSKRKRAAFMPPEVVDKARYYLRAVIARARRARGDLERCCSY